MKQDIELFIKQVSSGKYDNQKAKAVLNKLCKAYNLGLSKRLELEETIKTFTVKF